MSTSLIERDVGQDGHYTFTYLRTASRLFLERAKAEPEGRFYNCMAVNVFAAFCLEAYLNEIGRERLPWWHKVERRLAPREKVEVVAWQTGLRPDFGRKPFQSFNQLFGFRDLIAHAKPGEFGKIEDQCTPEQAEHWLVDVEGMVTAIHQQAGLGNYPFAIMGISVWSRHPPA